MFMEEFQAEMHEQATRHSTKYTNMHIQDNYITISDTNR